MPKKDIKLLAKDAIKAIKEANLTVEINVAGYRKPVGEAYPSFELLKMCNELGIDITFGSDAHKVEDIGFKYNSAISLAKEAGYSSCVSFINKDKLLHKF